MKLRFILKFICYLFGLFSVSFYTFAAEQDIFPEVETEKSLQVELFEFASPEKQKVAIELAKSLRCPQCQNQNLIESNSPIAKDLRLIVFDKINRGESEQQVIDFMTARYGQFVRYKPAFTLDNALLWLSPLLLLLVFFILSMNKMRLK